MVNLRNNTLPVFDIKSHAEEEAVSDIFVRVNSGGVKLKQNDFILTLLSLYWDEGRRMIEIFSKESTYPSKGKTTSYNQITTVDAQDIRNELCCNSVFSIQPSIFYKLSTIVFKANGFACFSNESLTKTVPSSDGFFHIAG